MDAGEVIQEDRVRKRAVARHEEDRSSSDGASAYTNDSNDANIDEGLVDNPLLHWKANEVERRAGNFARDHGLANQEDLFIKAGQILRDPEAWESVPNLTDEERDALRHENHSSFWQQPKELKVTILMLCVAAIVQGWNQTASNGANLNWPAQLGLVNIKSCDPIGRDAWIFAAVNAAPYLSASLIGCWVSDPLNEYFFGRRPAICISAILIFASSIGAACSDNWEQLIVCRVILGIGMGCKAAVVPVFAAEVSPAHIRGSLVMNWQLFDALGIFMGFTANLIVSQVGPTAWRWQFASSVFPTLVLLTLVFVASESPRFLIKQGMKKYRRAYETLLSLRGHPILAAKELLYVHYQIEFERQHICGTPSEAERMAGVRERDDNGRGRRWLGGHESARSINYWQKLGQLFTNARIRRAMVAAVVCMVGQQLCGVNVLAIYSSTFYCSADSGTTARQKAADPTYLEPLFLSWGIGLANFVFALPAYYLIDRKGRRWLLLVGLPFMALSMLAAGMSFKIPYSNPAHTPVIAFFTYVFMVFYSASMGPVPFTLSAEVFPLENRVVGMSFAVFTNMLGLGLLVLFVPALTYYIGHPGLLGIFAALNVVAFVLVFFFVRETSGAAVGRTPGSLTFMSLEELNYVFRVSTKTHAQYQVKTVLPWIWHRYFRRDSNAPLEPEQLYTWAKLQSDEKAMHEQEDVDEPEVLEE